MLIAVRHNNITKYLYVGMAHTGIVDPSTARAVSDIGPKHPVVSIIALYVIDEISGEDASLEKYVESDSSLGFGSTPSD